MNARIGLDGAEAAASELSPRQQQILALLRQGKANKQIAHELGIGIGTVKQHVVALFKKLNVTNRAMAVGRLQAAEPATAVAMAEETMERRLCVVLSLELAPGAAPSSARLLQRTIATVAFDFGGLMLARADGAGDVILGFAQPGPWDAYRAVEAAHAIADELARLDPAAAGLRGGIVAGLALVSTDRAGTWTGEMLASPAIAAARQLAAGAQGGQIDLDPSASDLLRNLDLAVGLRRSLVLADLDPLRPQSVRPLPILQGRGVECARLNADLDDLARGRGGVLAIVGEAGMGKSTLCRHLAQGAAQRLLPVRCWRLVDADLVPGRGVVLLDVMSGRRRDASEILDELNAVEASRPTALLLDDAHLLPAELLGELIAAARAHPAPLLLLIAGRTAMRLPDGVDVLGLRHLDLEATTLLVKAELRPEQHVADLVRLSGGVPLFAFELARQAARSGRLEVSPVVVAVVGARIDALGLDRRVLRRVAAQPEGIKVEELIGLLGEEAAVQAERAHAAGVLQRQANGRMQVRHPLVRLVLQKTLGDTL